LFSEILIKKVDVDVVKVFIFDDFLFLTFFMIQYMIDNMKLFITKSF